MRATSRDLLVHIAGDAHQFHSIMGKQRVSKVMFTIACSCGELCEVPATPESAAAMRNVPEARL